jgi:hypothetical protein
MQPAASALRMASKSAVFDSKGVTHQFQGGGHHILGGLGADDLANLCAACERELQCQETVMCLLCLSQ